MTSGGKYPPGRPVNTDRAVHIRRQTAYKLRLQGMSVPDIARKLETSDSTIYKYLQFIRAAVPTEEAEAARALISDRLDLLFSRLMPKVEAGDVRAIEAARAIEADRARLHNLHVARIEAHVVELTQADLELQQLLHEARARNAVLEGELRGEVSDVPAQP